MAHFNLSLMYRLGQGVEKDEKKKVYHLEEAAIGGDVQARHNLAVIEGSNGRMERAVKHWFIAANMGEEVSMKALWKYHAKGLVKKEALTATLRAHQAAVPSMQQKVHRGRKSKSFLRETKEAKRKQSYEIHELLKLRTKGGGSVR